MLPIATCSRPDVRLLSFAWKLLLGQNSCCLSALLGMPCLRTLHNIYHQNPQQVLSYSPTFFKKCSSVETEHPIACSFTATSAQTSCTHRYSVIFTVSRFIFTKMSFLSVSLWPTLLEIINNGLESNKSRASGKLKKRQTQDDRWKWRREGNRERESEVED